MRTRAAARGGIGIAAVAALALLTSVLVGASPSPPWSSPAGDLAGPDTASDAVLDPTRTRPAETPTVDEAAPPPPPDPSAPDGPATDVAGGDPGPGPAADAPLCPGFSGLGRANPLDDVLAGQVVLNDRAPVDVRDGAGGIDWGLDPYGDATWRLWFSSLRWLGSAIRAEDPAGLRFAQDVVADWAERHEVAELTGQAAEAVRHRANVLICLRERTGPADGLDELLADHAEFLIEHYSGDWNHGLDDNLALYAVGCALEDDDLRDHARERTEVLAAAALHPDGGSNEQAPGYDLYVHRRFALLLDHVEHCGDEVSDDLRERVEAMPAFLAHATKPDGHLPNIGDSYATDRPDDVEGTPMAHAHHLGAQGTPPDARTAVFEVGYAFGRSSWGTGGQDFTDASWWALRFGPERLVHGHEDRTSLLWYARGRDLLVDSGHVGYQDTSYRAFLRGLRAHNVLTIEDEPFDSAPTELLVTDFRDGADVLAVRDPSYPRFPRERTVMIASSPDVVVVLDRAAGPEPRTMTQHWHLPAELTAHVTAPGRVEAEADDTTLVVEQVPWPGTSVPSDGTEVVVGREDPYQGWRSPRVHERVAAPTVEFRHTTDDLALVTVLAAVDPRAEVRTSLHADGDGHRLEVVAGDEALTADIDAEGRITRSD
ncbi:heparinase II/III domain-containing protein [Egicoccus halophilus]|uniref:Heparinase II/III-like C-terminal domain-containing protein n=1 Tax=Egicoccus halophilus TaxID=1670830 RepID=A0A8J3EVE8_9ACTN|nr:heparinase II/III family protein [Egicoccus halophilus]GGI09559.1 hypothetical protein GCM10011354_34680 [Egicoccus halophilus]